MGPARRVVAAGAGVGFQAGGSMKMTHKPRSASPTIVLRISDGSAHMHRAFNDFAQAVRSAEAFAGAGFTVAMMAATGRFLMGFEPRTKARAAV